MNVSLSRTILFITIATFIVLGHVQVEASDEFTRDQYTGLWYVIRVMTPVSQCNPIIESATVRVRPRGYNIWKLQQFDNQILNGVRTERSVRGTISHSEVHLEIDPDDNDAVMTVTKYNNGDELILLGKESKLISRNRVASEEARLAFNSLAENANMLVICVNQDHR